MNWHGVQKIDTHAYVCGYCGVQVGSEKGLHTSGPERVLICPNCSRASFFDGRIVTPSARPGTSLKHLPDTVEKVYEEARNSIQAQAYSGAVLLCRKLLMHVACEKGANEGETFVHYIDYLDKNGYVPPDGKAWVDHVRQMGNRATHKIAFFTADEAVEVLTFTATLLMLVYEFPGRLKSKTPNP